MASLILILFGLGAASALATAVLSRALYAPLTRLLADQPPERRANLMVGWALLPLAAGLLVVAGILAPSLLAAAGLMADHCQVHGDHHQHLCLLHPGAAPALPASAPLLALLVAAPLAVAARRAAHRVRRGRAWRALRRLAASGGPEGCRVLEIQRPLAVTAGLLRPAVYLSRGLLGALTPEQVAAVGAHEAAHRRRGDPLRLALARLGARLHLPGTGRALQADLALATERAADEAAAHRVGDRAAVAEALVAVARMRPRSEGAVAFAAAPVELRVQALLADAPPPYRPWRGAGTALAGVAAMLATASPDLHHGLETLLGYL